MGIEGVSRRRDQAKKRRVRMAETVGKAGYLLDRRRRPAPIFPSTRNSRAKGLAPSLAGPIKARSYIANLKKGSAGRSRAEMSEPRIVRPLEGSAGLDPRATLRSGRGDPVDTATICDLGPSATFQSERYGKRMLPLEAPRRGAARPALRHRVEVILSYPCASFGPRRQASTRWPSRPTPLVL